MDLGSNRTLTQQQHLYVDSNTGRLASILKIVMHASSSYAYILSVVGCSCNLLSFLVLSRKAFKSTNISIYLRVLSILDTIVLLINLIKNLTYTFVGVSVTYFEVGCKLYFWLSNVAVYSSGWTLMVVTIERVIAVVRPHRLHIICSRNRAKAIAISIPFVWAGLLTYFAYLFGHSEIFDKRRNETILYRCEITRESKISIGVLLIFDGIFWAFSPSSILVVSTCIIVWGLRKSQKLRKTISKPSEVKDETNPSDGTDDSGHVGNDQPSRKKQSKEAAMTLTLVFVNISFVVCNFPIAVFVVLPAYLSPVTAEDRFIRDIVFTILVALMYTNNAMNFFLYFTTGTKFRQELKGLFTDVMRPNAKVVG